MRFDFLPKTNDYWMVVAWGRIRTSTDGQYTIDLILNKLLFTGAIEIEKHPDFELDNYQIHVCCSLSVLRAFSSGTIIRDQRIVTNAENYKNSLKRITIDPAQSNSRGLFGEVIGASDTFRFEHARRFPYYFICHAELAKMPVHYFQLGLGRVIIPDFVIANYYFFGSTGLIHSSIDGTIGGNIERNTVYDPTQKRIFETEKNKTVAVIRLEKGMKDIDAYKIARIAFDDFFRTKCLEISTNRIKSKNSFISCGYPIKGQVSLSVYGRRINSDNGIDYYVYHIAHCDSKPPFDGLVFTRDNPGGKSEPRSKQSMSTSEAVPFQRTVVIDYVPNKPIDAGGGKADYRSKERPIASNIPELNNITEDLVVKLVPDEDDTILSQKLENFTITLGAIGHTTSTIKQGSSRTVGVYLDYFVSLIYKRTFDCFDLIKGSTKMLLDKLRSADQPIIGSTLLRVPLGFPDCNYSRFDIEPFKDKPQEKQFCYIKIKKAQYRLYRCVYIEELLLDGRYFYVMDIEPKYSKRASSSDRPNYHHHKAVIIGADTRMSDSEIIQILTSLVENFGKWFFLSHFQKGYRILKHTSVERISDAMKAFVLKD